MEVLKAVGNGPKMHSAESKTTRNASG